MFAIERFWHKLRSSDPEKAVVVRHWGDRAKQCMRKCIGFRVLLPADITEKTNHEIPKTQDE
jgi:hypothetical protein